MDYLSAQKSKEKGVSSPNQAALFKDFHNLHGVWTHPWVLEQKPKDTESVDTDDEETENLETNDGSSPENLTAGDQNMRKLTLRFLNTLQKHIIPTLCLKQVKPKKNSQAMIYQLVGGSRYVMMGISKI